MNQRQVSLVLGAHESVLPGKPLEQRLAAIAEVYGGDLNSLRVATKQRRDQKFHESRTNRGAYGTKEDHSCASNTCKAARAANQEYRCVFCEMFDEEETSNISSSSSSSSSSSPSSSSTDTHQETKKERKKRLKQEKKEKEEQLVKEARENTMSPTVQEMSSWDKTFDLLPKCRELKIAGNSNDNKVKLATKIKMEWLRLRRQVHG